MHSKEAAQLEALLVGDRIQELQHNPISGNFDVAHLCKTHRYIFQDLPRAGLWEHDVQPGEFRTETNFWMKTRKLGSFGSESFTVYSRMSGKDIEKLSTVLQGANPENFKGLDKKAFVEKISTLYSDIDYLHPFREGNSRTLRTFTEQLAKKAGYELCWEKLNTQRHYDLLYIARDRGLAERAMKDYDPNHPGVQRAYSDMNQYLLYPDLSQLLKQTVERTQTQEHYAPRHDLSKNQAEIHAEAEARMLENLETLKRNPAFADRTPEDLNKLAYMRGIVQENVQNLPKAVQEAALARFDKNAEDPSFLRRMIGQLQEKAEPQAETQSRGQKRDDDGMER